jgi:MFS transporter, UMF1 family
MIENRKVINAWVFYDWANSVYSLIITSAIFPIYYGLLFVNNTNIVSAFGIDFKRTALITLLTSVTFLLISFLSPLLSGIADYTGNKKGFLKFFCYVGAFGAFGLNWFSLEQIHLSLFFYFLGLIGFWCSLVFYNSYLPDIANPENYDKISARGFSFGYIGSVLLMLFNLSMILFPSIYGIEGEEREVALTAMRYSFISVGIWWVVFSQYTFHYLPKGNSKNKKVNGNVFFNGFKELKSVYGSIKKNERLIKYLRAFFVYSMAVQTIMLVATYFGEQEINWGDTDKTTGLIVSILLIQLIAVLGAYLTSFLSNKIGNIKALIVVNIIWVFICFYGYFVVTPMQFYVTAAFVGLVMGGIQSLSRSTYSKFLPDTKDTASYFSFYDVTEKIGIVIGMGIFGLIDQYSDSMRNAIIFLAVFFIIGILLLRKVTKITS